jgi:NAD-dependent SIR2 family protein deacetylase
LGVSLSASVNILPDSRAKTNRGSIWTRQGNFIPIYCAQCHKQWGMVPERMITGAFALCDPCSEKWGPIAHTYQESDAAFWRRAAECQKEEFGRMLNPFELAVQLDDLTSVLAGLANEWRIRMLKER